MARLLHAGWALAFLAAASSVLAERSIEYPTTVRNHQQDVYEIMIEDPYRWLEDDVRTSPQVAAWVAAQNKLTFGYRNNFV